VLDLAAMDGEFGTMWAPAMRRAYLKLQATVAAELSGLPAEVPVVALADGPLTGAAAGLFMSATHRVSTANGGDISIPSCAVGLCPSCGTLALLTSGATCWPSCWSYRDTHVRICRCRVGTS